VQNTPFKKSISNQQYREVVAAATRSLHISCNKSHNQSKTKNQCKKIFFNPSNPSIKLVQIMQFEKMAILEKASYLLATVFSQRGNRG